MKKAVRETENRYFSQKGREGRMNTLGATNRAILGMSSKLYAYTVLLQLFLKLQVLYYWSTCHLLM